jgi:hypothetical protein
MVPSCGINRRPVRAEPALLHADPNDWNAAIVVAQSGHFEDAAAGIEGISLEVADVREGSGPAFKPLWRQLMPDAFSRQ